MMPRKLTYEQKLYRIEQEFRQKEYALKVRIEQKYKSKIDNEYEKKHIQLMKAKDRKIHNLKVNEGQMRSNAKIKVKKPSRTAEKKKTRTRWSRKDKLLKSKKVGNKYIGECYVCKNCYGKPHSLVVVERIKEENKFKWNIDAQSGHMIKKGQYDTIKYCSSVIRLQCRKTNVFQGHDQKLREEKRKEEVGQEEYDRIVALKFSTFTISTQEIIDLGKECKKFVLNSLLELKG